MEVEVWRLEWARGRVCSRGWRRARVRVEEGDLVREVGVRAGMILVSVMVKHRFRHRLKYRRGHQERDTDRHRQSRSHKQSHKQNHSQHLLHSLSRPGRRGEVDSFERGEVGCSKRSGYT